MLKADFKSLLNAFASGDPKLAIEDEKVKLTPAQAAMDGLTQGLEESRDVPMVEGMQEGRPTLTVGEPNSTTASPQQEGYAPLSGALQGAVEDQPVTPSTRPAPMGLDASLQQKQQALLDAQNQPVDKHTSKWKDVLAYIVQGANAAFNPNPNNKIEGYGKIKHDIGVRNAQAELNPLMKQKEWETEMGLKSATANQRQADAIETMGRPARDAAKQKAEIEEQRRKEEIEGKKWKPTTRNGKYYKQYNDGREEPLLGPDGKQEVELREVPVKTIVDGQEVWTIGDKVIDRKIAEEYRQAQMTMDADKYNATEINNYTESLDKWASDAQQAQNKITQLKADGQGKLTEADQLESQANAIQETTDEFGDTVPVTPEAAAAKLKLQTKAAELRREGASLHRQASEYKLPPKPTKPKATLSAPKLGVGTYSEADFVTKAIAKGITGDNLKRAVQQAKKDRIIK